MAWKPWPCGRRTPAPSRCWHAPQRKTRTCRRPAGWSTWGNISRWSRFCSSARPGSSAWGQSRRPPTAAAPSSASSGKESRSENGRRLLNWQQLQRSGESLTMGYGWWIMDNRSAVNPPKKWGWAKTSGTQARPPTSSRSSKFSGKINNSVTSYI